MSKLEPTQTSPADEETSVTVSIDGGTTRVSVPADATSQEAAAVAVAVGAHLTDRQRAAAAVGASEGPRPADPWQLVDRLGLDGPDRWLDVEDGEEWRAAGRRY